MIVLLILVVFEMYSRISREAVSQRLKKVNFHCVNFRYWFSPEAIRRVLLLLSLPLRYLVVLMSLKHKTRPLLLWILAFGISCVFIELVTTGYHRVAYVLHTCYDTFYERFVPFLLNTIFNTLPHMLLSVLQ